MSAYLEHHQSIAGMKTNVFEPDAVTAIHQAPEAYLKDNTSYEDC